MMIDFLVDSLYQQPQHFQGLFSFKDYFEGFGNIFEGFKNTFKKICFEDI